MSLVKGQTESYKVYAALLTQSGTDAPVATVLENTLGGTIVWTRNTIGNYTATLTGAFTLNKTCIVLGSNININDIDNAVLNTSTLTVNDFILYTNATDTIAWDDVLLNTSIEIRVYN